VKSTSFEAPFTFKIVLFSAAMTTSPQRCLQFVPSSETAEFADQHDRNGDNNQELTNDSHQRTHRTGCNSDDGAHVQDDPKKSASCPDDNLLRDLERNFDNHLMIFDLEDAEDLLFLQDYQPTRGEHYRRRSASEDLGGDHDDDDSLPDSVILTMARRFNKQNAETGVSDQVQYERMLAQHRFSADFEDRT
jgi:hypothetical protein